MFDFNWGVFWAMLAALFLFNAVRFGIKVWSGLYDR